MPKITKLIIYSFFQKIINSKYFVIILYLAIYLFVFGKLIFKEGMPVGNDWGFPVFGYQLKNWLLRDLYAWSNNLGNIFGSRLSYSVALPFQFVAYFLNQTFGMSGEFYQKILFIFSFLVGGISSYLLFLKYNSRKFFAFLGGILFTLNPVIFNFLLMGWNLAIISIFSLPLILLLFEYYFESKKIKFIVWIGLIFGIFGFMESQSIVHFSIFLVVYFFIKNKVNVELMKEFIKIFSLIFIIIFGLHASWLLLLVFIKDPYIASSVAQNDVVRFALKFSYHDIIKGWGSVYNYQFEYSYPKILDVFSFLPPFLLSFLFIFKKIKNIGWFFVFLFFYPFIMYLFSQNLSMHIPYTNIIRDYGRSFPYLFLATAYFISMVKKENLIMKALIIGILLIYLLPFINGSLYGVKDSKATGISTCDIDQRLRLFKFDRDVVEIDQNIAQKKIDKKGLVIPTGTAFIILGDRRFNGMWAAMWDYSYTFSDRIKNPMYTGNTQENMKIFFKNYSSVFNILNCDSKVDVFLKDLTDKNFFYVIVRKNVNTASSNMDSDDIERCLDKSSEAVIIKDYANYKLYEINNKYFLPHLYTSQSIITTSQSTENLPKIVSQSDYKIRSAIYFNNSNQISAAVNTLATSSEPVFNPNELKIETINNTPVIEFKKINPTKYRVIIHHATENFPLVFSESFHDGWKSYLVDDKKTPVNFNQSDYKILDGNGDDQASTDELNNLISSGYISSLGNLKEKNIKHVKWEDGKETFNYNEPYKIDFISKNFQDTIQNDNLESGHFYETWFKEPIDDNKNHLMVNGYANSWNINPNELCLNNAKCVKNADGSYDMELVIEFWPQRLFYVGLFISGATLLGCLGYLGWGIIRKKRGIEIVKDDYYANPE